MKLGACRARTMHQCLGWRLVTATCIVASVLVYGAHAAGASVRAVTVTCGQATSPAGPPVTIWTLSGCNHTSVTGGGGVIDNFFTVMAPASGNATIHWASGGATTFSWTYNPILGNKGPCADKPLIIIKGRVTSSGPSPIAGAVRARICLFAPVTGSYFGLATSRTRMTI